MLNYSRARRSSASRGPPVLRSAALPVPIARMYRGVVAHQTAAFAVCGSSHTRISIQWSLGSVVFAPEEPRTPTTGARATTTRESEGSFQSLRFVVFAREGLGHIWETAGRGLRSSALVQITVWRMTDDLRLRRLLCGKAPPFRGGEITANLLRAVWKAEPPRRCGGRRNGQTGPERQSLSAQRSGRAAWSTTASR